MARTDSFKEQHKDMLELVKQITQKLDPSTLADNAVEVRSILSALAGKLLIHLTMEDKNLYPVMLESNNDEAKKTAQSFMDEMGTLAATFKAYTQKWPSPKEIQDNPSGFCDETKALFQAMGQRIGKEESTLYPLADKI
ncbi:MAG: hemerythrin domain-containing protein [Rickettsiales bacterium]